MTPNELQRRLDGPSPHEHEQDSFAISPRLDAMIRTLPEAERRVFMGKLWSLQRVYSGLVLYRKANMLIHSTFANRT